MDDMTDQTEQARGSWQDTFNLVFGFWLFFSPAFLTFVMAHAETWVTAGLGLVLAALAGASLVTTRNWKEWGMIALGAALIAAPWALPYESAPLWNSAICGAAVIVLAVSRLHDIHGEGKSGHGHGIPAAS